MEDKARYPIGKFQAPKEYSHNLLHAYIADIENLPAKLQQEIQYLQADQLEVPYRPGGWNIRQVVHHLSDSHMNALIRMKLALTEDVPTIKPYREQDWAELADSQDVPLQTSVSILEGVHIKLVTLLKSLNADQWLRTYIHPEMGREVMLAEMAGIYAWHGRHHLAHITSLKERNDWS